MKILQGGAPKCGNFWLYQIIQQVLQQAGRDATSFIQTQPIYELAKTWNLNYPSQASIDVLDITDLQYSYRISSVFRMPIVDIKSYIAQTNHVWTHSPICKRSGELLHLFDKKIYIIRDPRDRALSAAKYYTSEYMLTYYPQEEKDPKRFLEKNFDQLLQEWVWHVYDHVRLSQSCNIHLVFYEQFLNHFQEELNRLLTYLELELSPVQKEAIQDAVSFTTLKSKNPKHLNKGQAGYWAQHLTEDQVAKADMIAGPLIRFLNYHPSPDETGAINPAVTHDDFEQLKQDIVASQAQLYERV
ncbi:sulfotransferase domain-containing protein [Pontibacter sp. SGAir0037]|uniref:sulfotransferase domain-containing protein n=1 Tax=Pontibacter sp. SGAir0037 TaxID=2571030 RepID=UPI0010CD2F3B|nr:sulfotransferase domain-containing protein [Pontibacter sp. SGAir0037]QCR21382.1 hypothetical protein C1N53_02805 [Pontibacter sp. SGAir0037]